MHYDIADARYAGGYKIALTFADGREGSADLSGYVSRGGVFARFSDIEYFKRFFVNRELGALCWPDGVDIAPETLYHEATGEPLPAWAGTKEAGRR